MRHKPRSDALAMVALNLDDAVFRRAAGSAVAFELFGNLLDLARVESGYDAHRTGAAALAKDSNETVVGNAPYCRHATRFREARSIRLPKRQAMSRRICVFCGSSPGFDASFVRVAAGAAAAIVRAGYGVVYGGGRIGLMGAVADAALAAGGEVVGVIPQALSRAEIEHTGLTKLHVVGSMHERKALMADASDGFVALPGGFGTMDEFCEILSWRQLGIHNKPIGLLNQDGYYDSLLALFDGMVDRGFLRLSHRELFVAAPSIDELLRKMFAEPVKTVTPKIG